MAGSKAPKGVKRTAKKAHVTGLYARSEDGARTLIGRRRVATPGAGTEETSSSRRAPARRPGGRGSHRAARSQSPLPEVTSSDSEEEQEDEEQQEEEEHEQEGSDAEDGSDRDEEEEQQPSDPESEEDEDLFAHPLPQLGKVWPADKKPFLRGPTRLPEPPYPHRHHLVRPDGDT